MITVVTDARGYKSNWDILDFQLTQGHVWKNRFKNKQR